MNWIKLQTDIFSTPEYILAEPTDRATWMALLVFCAKNENHGTIVACREWKDRTWQQLAAVTLSEVNRTCDLFRWVGNSLTVSFYPSDTEELLKSKRDASAKAHKAKAAKMQNVAMPQSQEWQRQNEESGEAKEPAKSEVLALQSRVDKSRADKNRTEQTQEAQEAGDYFKKDSDEFSEWYALYPKKIGELEAQREWIASKHQRPPTGELIEILEQHMTSQEWQAEAGKFIPRPAAYLNGQRWKDRLTPGKKVKPPAPERPKVDEKDAFRWRCETYPMSKDIHPTPESFPFKNWPSDTQAEYLKTTLNPTDK
jgi:hypothetical protein